LNSEVKIICPMNSGLHESKTATGSGIERKRDREKEMTREEAKQNSSSLSLSSVPSPRKKNSFSQPPEGGTTPSFQLVSCIGTPAPRGW